MGELQPEYSPLPPLVKEILEQHKLILEMQKLVLLPYLKPPLIYKEKK